MTGTVVAIQMQAAGYNWEIDALDRLVIRDQQRSFESTFLLVPTSTTGIWTSSDVMLTTPLRNYSVSDYPRFFDAIGYPEGRLKLEAIQSAGHNFTNQDMGVPIYCFYSKGTPTPERLVYDSISTFPDSEPLVEMGEGDGTVNLRSLEACSRWQYIQHKQPVTVKHYADIGHHELLHLPSLISDVLRVAIKPTQ